jgi:signal transduction histidine kinase/ligand-binding sensor domain-containing protein
MRVQDVLCQRDSNRRELTAKVLAPALMLVLAFTIQGWALDATPSDIPYIRTTFSVEDGLSSNVVPAILQTREGFLWVGTRDGLLRFDGRHFTAVPFPQRASGAVYVNTLAEGPDGDVWIGGTEGLAEISKDPLQQLDHAHSALYLPGSGASNDIECLHFGRDGVLWVGTDAGLFRFQGGKFSTIIPDLMISRIEESSTGHLLVITSAGFVEWDGASILRHADLPGRLGVKADRIFHVYEDRHGVTWYCTEKGVARSKGDSIERLTPWGGSSDTAFRVYEDANGTVWVSRYNDLLRATDAGLQLVFPNLHSRCFISDRDGDMWVGTNGGGLVKFKNRTVRMFDVGDGLPAGVPKAVLTASDGKLWVGSNCGGVSWFDGSRFHTYSAADGLLDPCVFSLAEDRDKSILIGTYGGGVFRFRDGHFAEISQPNILGVSVATALIPARDGSLWIAYSDGLILLEQGRTRRFTTADGLSSDQVYSAYEDRRGDIWVETSAGIDRFVQNHFVAVAPLYQAIFREDQVGGLFALAYRNGAFELKGNQPIELKAAPQVMGMATSANQLWFCGAGIYRVPLQSVEAWAKEPAGPRDYTLFGRRDGMNSADCSDGFPNMAITGDGKLWVATNQGVAMLPSSQAPPNQRAPAIYMQKIVVEKTVDPPSHDLVLAPGTHHLELDFGVSELASPERVRFQYRMDDVDLDWSDPDTSGSAVYNSLPIGTHKFHIRATNGDGIWDREGIVYEVTEKAHYYQTTLFRVMAALMLTGILALTFKLRLYQMRLNITQRLNERVTERTRLARELHDTLLQTIQATKIVADSVLNEPKDSDRVRLALERISLWLGRATSEGREAVSSLRGSFTQSDDLVNALLQLDQEFSGGPMKIATTVEGRARDVHPIIGNEVCRIGREAIQNACKHSKGSRINAALRYDRDLILRVEDDGIGISDEIISKGKAYHFGLQGMGERARRIGAKLSFYSTNPGTHVELVVPGRLAYRKKP